MVNHSLNSVVVVVRLVVDVRSDATAVVVIIPINYQPPPPLVVVVVVRRTSSSHRLTWGGHEFVVGPPESSRPTPRMIHRVHER